MRYILLIALLLVCSCGKSSPTDTGYIYIHVTAEPDSTEVLSK